ncbi:hypothetical protein PAAL109150_09990 [Paenibacillus alkaliterrae]
MNHISPCCHKEIIVRTHVEFPLGGRTWGMSYKYDACAGCGNEVEEYVHACEECGEVRCECDAGTVSVVGSEDVKQTEQPEVG